MCAVGAQGACSVGLSDGFRVQLVMSSNFGEPGVCLHFIVVIASRASCPLSNCCMSFDC